MGKNAKQKNIKSLFTLADKEGSFVSNNRVLFNVSST